MQSAFSVKPGTSVQWREVQRVQRVAAAGRHVQATAPAISRPLSRISESRAAGERELAAEHQRRPSPFAGAQLDALGRRRR